MNKTSARLNTPESAASQPEQAAEPGASQVVDYLRAHPEFFVEHENLLADLKLPHESGAAISLVQKQVSVFRAQRDSYEHQLNSLIETARENDQLFSKSKRLLTSLLEADSLDEVLIVLQDGFLHDFGVDFCELLVFENADCDLPASRTSMPANVHSISSVVASHSLGDLLTPGKVSFGRLTAAQREILFPTCSNEVGSCAVIPLQYESPLGLLSIASRELDYFNSSMGTMFLTYIADTLARILPPLLCAPKAAILDG